MPQQQKTQTHLNNLAIRWPLQPQQPSNAAKSNDSMMRTSIINGEDTIMRERMSENAKGTEGEWMRERVDGQREATSLPH